MLMVVVTTCSTGFAITGSTGTSSSAIAASSGGVSCTVGGSSIVMIGSVAGRLADASPSDPARPAMVHLRVGPV